jgi:two-component system nitrogen regulation sensor histidine kinase NtrY
VNTLVPLQSDGLETFPSEGREEILPDFDKRDSSQSIASEPIQPFIKRAPRIARSAFFGVLFMTAMFVTILGALLSFSQEQTQIDQSFDLLRANLILIGILVFYLGYRVWTTLFTKARRRTAPLLHRRFVFIFSLAALVPAITVGVFSLSFISQNLNDIFGDDVRENMTQARAILDDYVDQELAELGKDINALSISLDAKPEDIQSRISFTAALQIEARVRDLDSVYVLSNQGDVLTRVESPFAPQLRVPTDEIFQSVSQGGVAYQKRDDLDYLIALTPLPGFANVYLYVGRALRSDSQVLSSISGIEGATESLKAFNTRQAKMRSIFVLTLVETAILILMAAIWLGLLLGNRIIDPLGRLITAAERVRSGDMSAKVDVSSDWGEISDLGSAFNRMTQQLNSQRDALVKEHDISEQRRQFSEAVLSGVRAGVIGLTQTGRITLVNKSAELLLGVDGKSLLGAPIDEVLAEFAPAFKKGRESIHASAEDQVNFEIDGQIRNFDLRVSAYQGARKDTGWVLTFDDMTRLVSAQRHSAWREVARRIAHEIKNPLTPIQLSAERLERKYEKEITSDKQTFTNCTQTIIRQVGSLEQMVNEFSAFARMPAPEFAEVNIQSLLDEVLFEQGVAFPEITFLQGEKPEGDIVIWGDDRLITQALTNIFKNAGEAVLRSYDKSGDEENDGLITVDLIDKEDLITIKIIDNGPGWPSADKNRLLEPYVTTRESGTGLGLAIVKRIAEDHGGSLTLADPANGRRGACVKIRFPKHSHKGVSERATS